MTADLRAKQQEACEIMISKVSAMHSAQMETACRKMAESYVDYEMTGRNLGMCEHLDKEHFYCLTRGYFEAAVRNGSLYCAGDKQEGYFIFETPETKRTLYGSLLQAKWSLRAFGLKKGIRYVKEIMNSGTYLASELGRQKKPFTKIEFIAVAKEHQGQGYMRQMMEYAFSESDRLGLPLILTTDDPKKVKLYEHFGLKMVREHMVSDRAVYYEMLREYRRNNLLSFLLSLHRNFVSLQSMYQAI